MGKRVVRTKEQYQSAVRELRQKIQQRADSIWFESASAFIDYCLEVLRRAVANAPVDSGMLRGSAFLEINGAVVAYGAPEGGITTASMPEPPEPGGSIHARIAFPMPYALIQHEHPEFNHPLGGQAFYLEIAVEESTREFMQRMREIARG